MIKRFLIEFDEDERLVSPIYELLQNLKGVKLLETRIMVAASNGKETKRE